MLPKNYIDTPVLEDIFQLLTGAVLNQLRALKPLCRCPLNIHDRLTGRGYFWYLSISMKVDDGRGVSPRMATWDPHYILWKDSRILNIGWEGIKLGFQNAGASEEHTLPAA